MARPKAFDPDVVLDKAMLLFWEKGYGATSVQDLVDRMGVNRFSLYDTFGDKRALYLKALDRYRDQQFTQLVRPLEDATDGLAAVVRYFEQLEEACRANGCLMQQATLELAAVDVDVGARVQVYHVRHEKALHGALKRASAAGQLPGRRNLRDLARFLYAGAQGLIVMGRSGHDAGGAVGLRRFVETEFARPVAA